MIAKPVRNLRVVHTAAELNNEASGPSHSVPNLVYWLNHMGIDASLQALMPAPKRQLDFPQTYHPKWRLLEPLGISPKMRRSLEEVAKEIDIIHSNNLWMMPNIYPYEIARRHGCKLVVSPRGTLTPWSFRFNWWKKQFIWSAAQKRVVFAADLVHATSADEVEGLRALGVSAPIALIPNGVVIPQLRNGQTSHPPRTLLFLGRIHPKKGVDKLLRAWQILAGRHQDWSLEIVGPDNGGYLPKMQRLAHELSLERCRFTGPILGKAKREKFQGAGVFVLPTHSENFGIAVAEALAHGVPAVVTKGAPWEGLETKRCGIWIDDDDDALVSALDSMMNLTDDERKAMGARGREWMEQSFSWRLMAQMMAQTYRWIAGRGERPDCVRI